jgi:hypothetical protein
MFLKYGTNTIVIEMPQEVASAVCASIIHDDHLDVDPIITFEAAVDCLLEVAFAIESGYYDGNVGHTMM